jgi:hypothetical protein
MRWSALRQFLRDSRRKVKQARQQRKRELTKIRSDCEAKRKALVRSCADQRTGARHAARDVQRVQKRARDDAWDTYRWFTHGGRSAPRRKLSAAESDDLATHELPDELHGLWRRHAKDFDRALPRQRERERDRKR